MKAVIALQKLILDETKKVSHIIQHAHLIASKLDLSDFKNWCSLEMNGYLHVPKEQIPNYRYINGTIGVRHLFSGMVNTFGNAPISLSHKVMFDSVSKLEAYSYDEKGNTALKLDQEVNSYFAQHVPYYDECVGYLIVNKSEFDNALYMIKSKVLEFTEELERNGILGEEWEFTKEEKQMTQNVNYHIGNVGNMANHNENSTINQTSTNTVQVVKGNFDSLATKLKDYGVEESDIQDLKKIIDVTPQPLSSEQFGDGVTTWLGRMSLKALKGSLTVGKDIAMAVLVEAISSYYGF